MLLPRGVNLADLREPDVHFPTINSLHTFSDINCGNLGTSAIGYVTSEFGDNLFPNNNLFIVGDPNQPNDRPNNYTNGQLCSATNYTFFVRAYTVVSRLLNKCPQFTYLINALLGAKFIAKCWTH